MQSRRQRLKQARAEDECGGPGVWLLRVCCSREEFEQFLGRISPRDISIRKGLEEQGEFRCCWLSSPSLGVLGCSALFQ